MKPTIYIDPKGVVKYIPEWSGQPNAIEFVDQTQVISALNIHFGGECAVDTILPLPEGWRVEVIKVAVLLPSSEIKLDRLGNTNHPELSHNTGESQEELTALDLKMFIEHELGGYKTVHMGRSYRVINRQFVYESDIMSLAEDLLRNFTITRNLKKNQ